MKRELIEDITAHILAGVITLGFFVTVLIALLGYVDLKDATSASLVGIVMGYVAGSINPVLSRYFKAEMPTEFPKDTQGIQQPPKPNPPGDTEHRR